MRSRPHSTLLLHWIPSTLFQHAHGPALHSLKGNNSLPTFLDPPPHEHLPSVQGPQPAWPKGSTPPALGACCLLFSLAGSGQPEGVPGSSVVAILPALCLTQCSHVASRIPGRLTVDPGFRTHSAVVGDPCLPIFCPFSGGIGPAVMVVSWQCLIPSRHQTWVRCVVGR